MIFTDFLIESLNYETLIPINTTDGFRRKILHLDYLHRLIARKLKNAALEKVLK